MHATAREVRRAPGPVVLVVDPDWDTRQILRALLESTNHGVIEAADGEEALRLLNEHRPDLVVTEHPVRLETGETFLRVAIQSRGVSPGSIVVHTSHVLPENLAEVCAIGCTRIVLKPSTVGRTMEAIHRALHPEVDRGRAAGALPDPLARAGRALPARRPSCLRPG